MPAAPLGCGKLFKAPLYLVQIEFNLSRHVRLGNTSYFFVGEKMLNLF